MYICDRCEVRVPMQTTADTCPLGWSVNQIEGLGAVHLCDACTRGLQDWWATKEPSKKVSRVTRAARLQWLKDRPEICGKPHDEIIDAMKRAGMLAFSTNPVDVHLDGYLRKIDGRQLDINPQQKEDDSEDFVE